MDRSPIAVGQRFEDFTYDTAWEQGSTLFQTLDKGKTIFIFSRYIGCPPCLLELMNLSKTYPKIKQAGGELLVVMQSDPAIVRDTLDPGVSYKQEDGSSVFGREQMPFDLILDPTMALYVKYGIPVAKNKLDLVSPSSLAKSKRASAMGLAHGAYEGEELQFPATFLLDSDGTVLFAHIGRSFADYLSEDALIKILTTG